MLISIPWTSTEYGFQLAFDDATECNVKGRGRSTSWGPWRTFLTTGNYDTWCAKKTHTHTKADITDFPTSMPASDVYAWAKKSSLDVNDLPSHTHGYWTWNEDTIKGVKVNNAVNADTIGGKTVNDIIDILGYQKRVTYQNNSSGFNQTNAFWVKVANVGEWKNNVSTKVRFDIEALNGSDAPQVTSFSIMKSYDNQTDSYRGYYITQHESTSYAADDGQYRRVIVDSANDIWLYYGKVWVGQAITTRITMKCNGSNFTLYNQADAKKTITTTAPTPICSSADFTFNTKYTALKTNEGSVDAKTIYAISGFYKKDSSNEHVLLGAGGHKALSDFSMAHSHPYLSTGGGTLTGGLTVGGNLTVNGTSINAKNYLFMNSGGDGVYLHSSGLSWHDSTNGYVSGLISCASDSIRLGQSTSINGTLSSSNIYISNGVGNYACLNIGDSTSGQRVLVHNAGVYSDARAAALSLYKDGNNHIGGIGIGKDGDPIYLDKDWNITNLSKEGHTHTGLKFAATSTENIEDTKLDTFNIYRTSASTTGGSDGWIMDYTWNSAKYKTQLYIDVDNTYKMCMRHRTIDGVWKEWKQFALTSDIPTNTNQLTNGAGYITSSGSITGNAATATQASNSLRLMEYYNLDRNHDSTVIKPSELPVGIINQFTDKTGANSSFTWNTIVSMSSYSGGSSSGAGYRAQFLFPNSYNADSYDKGTFYIRYGVDNTWNSWNAVITAANIGSYALTNASAFTRFYLSPMASNAPADSAKSWFTDTMPSGSGAIVYNVPGSEKTIIAGKSSGAFGHMLQLNYDDNYLRLLRYFSGSWKTTDWEKISAGYADTA